MVVGYCPFGGEKGEEGRGLASVGSRRVGWGGFGIDILVRVRVRVRVIVRILHKADLYQLLVSTTDLEFGVLFRRLE